jgi:hypothetical protein
MLHMPAFLHQFDWALDVAPAVVPAKWNVLRYLAQTTMNTCCMAALALVSSL